MPVEVLQLGAVAVIFLFAVKEFFSYLKSRNNDGAGTDLQKYLRETNELQKYINDQQANFNQEMKNHALVANQEMGEIKLAIQDIKRDISEINSKIGHIMKMLK